MKNITLRIDDKDIPANEGMTILEAAKNAKIEIPTLCHNDELEPYGACRICSVEIDRKGRTQLVASCCYPVEDGLKVKTRSHKIDKIRKTIIELAAVSAGIDMIGRMRELASEYNADLSRFRSNVKSDPSKCILCGLCVRRCIEATWDTAIGFIGRGVTRKIATFPEKLSVCTNCNHCYSVCPTGRISSIGADPKFPEIDDILAGRE